MKVTVTRKKRGSLGKILDLFKRPQPQVELGFPEGEVDADVAARALWNEFGTRTIPERPFMRNSLRNNLPKYKRIIASESRKIIAGQTTPERVMNKLGIIGQGDIQEEITALDTPPNAPSTIRRKGSSNPLIDTGEMRQAVTYRVKYGK